MRIGGRRRGRYSTVLEGDYRTDVAVLLRGEHRRFLPTKLEMADVAFDVLLDKIVQERIRIATADYRKMISRSASMSQ